MAEKTTTTDNKYDYVVQELLSGNKWYYRALRGLQEAMEFKGIIPKSHFVKYDDCSFTSYFKIGKTKNEVRDAKYELIEAIVKTIKSHQTLDGEKMLHDHYARLFHALAILKVNKSTLLLPGTLKDNFIYNAMYTLWRADDGSEDAEKGILSAAWFLSEEYKYLTGGKKRDCIEGKRC